MFAGGGLAAPLRCLLCCAAALLLLLLLRRPGLAAGGGGAGEAAAGGGRGDSGDRDVAPGSLVSSVVLPVILEVMGETRESAERAWQDEGARACLGDALAQDETVSNLTRVTALLSKPPGDPILVLRGALRRLAATVTRLSDAAGHCSGAGRGPPDDGAKEAGGGGADDAAGAVRKLGAAAAKFEGFVEAGKINDGHCPFKGSRQTTVGGADVRRLLGSLSAASWAPGAGASRASKTVGKILRKVHRADGQDPPGMPPVNWDMRSRMFGGSKLEL